LPAGHRDCRCSRNSVLTPARARMTLRKPVSAWKPDELVYRLFEANRRADVLQALRHEVVDALAAKVFKNTGAPGGPLSEAVRHGATGTKARSRRRLDPPRGAARCWANLGLRKVGPLKARNNVLTIRLVVPVLRLEPASAVIADRWRIARRSRSRRSGAADFRFDRQGSSSEQH